jgi:hypothetical protein
VHFHTEHHFSASPDAVLGVLSDPDFYLGLHLPDLAAPELLSNERKGQTSTIRLRYEFVGRLDKKALRLLGDKSLTWLQTVVVNSAERAGSLSFGAERQPKMLHGDATFTLAKRAEETVRELDGDLTVAVPVIGSMAERRIVPGVVRRLDIEAAALEAAVGKSSGGALA